MPTRQASTDAPFSIPVQVYWEDTDAGGIVYYANYLRYFERARSDWLRALGVSQQRMRQDDGALFVVAAADLKYHRPARLDDRLAVTVTLAQAGRATWQFHQQALRGDELLCDGHIRVGCVDAARFRPCRIPDAIAALVTPSDVPSA
ncbi:MAG: tol-pal system-associated acyl-CoA thioesterase [Aquabacterium sp.]